MSNIHSIDEQARLKQQSQLSEEQILAGASDWIAKLDRGLSTPEQQVLKAWLAADARHIAVLLEVAQMWDKMDDLSRLSDLFPQTAAKKSKTGTWIAAIAASLVLALTLIFYQGNHGLIPFSQESAAGLVAMQASYQTRTGESNTISLPDNSKIVLNTNSFVQVKYTATARIIELQRGEIHIDVAHDKTRPLSVIAGGEIIQAVGTAFNVEVRNELVELIVTDGKVLVAKNKNSSINLDLEQMAKKLPKNSMQLSKGEKVNLDVSGQTPEKIVKVDPMEIAASLSWRHGNLIFRGESLADAMAEDRKSVV